VTLSVSAKSGDNREREGSHPISPPRVPNVEPTQQVGEQVMVARLLLLVVQGNQEQVAAGQPLQQSAAMRTPNDRVAQAAVQFAQDRSLQQQRRVMKEWSGARWAGGLRVIC
jgi:hypothetical protein